jgi:hypothetical protein
MTQQTQKQLITQDAELVRTNAVQFLDSNATLVKILDEAQNANALLLTQSVKKITKEIKAIYKDSVEPLKTDIKAIDELFKPVIERLSDLSKNLTTVMLDYKHHVADVRAGRLKAADTLENLGGDSRVIEHLVNTAPALVANNAEAFSRKTWTGEITDFPTFAKWAVENNRFDLLQVDQVALNTLVRETKEAFNVPGAKANASETIVVR